MRAFLAAFVLSVTTAVLLTPLVRRLAFRIGAVDHPGGRRVHRHSTPRLGGIAICLALVAPITGLFFVDSEVARSISDQYLLAIGAGVGGIILCCLGVFDDTWGVRAQYKLYVQIAVAIGAFVSGFRIEAVSLPVIGPVEMGIFALPITILWIVGIINAVNLIDGLDGLAAGVVFFAALTNFVVAYLSGAYLVAVFMAATAGAVAGFLLFNFNPARIFMGDSGSYLLGYLLGIMALAGASQKASTTIALLVPIIALGVPIFDTLFSMVRRFIERRPLFAADRGHIHHRLVDMGITQRRAVLILYGVSIVFTAAAILLSLGRNWEVGVAIFVASAVLIGLIRFVGYFDYLQLQRRQRARLRSHHCEVFRRLVFEARGYLFAARSSAELDAAIERLRGEGELLSIEVIEVDGHEERVVQSWGETTAVRGRDREQVVSARFPLEDVAPRQCEIKFRWRTESNDVSPQMDMLLQLVTDLIAEQRRRLPTTLGDHGTAPLTASVVTGVSAPGLPAD